MIRLAVRERITRSEAGAVRFLYQECYTMSMVSVVVAKEE
jgi:hypothetical protein